MSGTIKDNKKNQETYADVLYQRIEGKWYAFSVVEDDIFYTAISDEELEAIRLDQNKKFEPTA
jgi:hypothetical protein